MTGLRAQHHWRYIGAENEARVWLAVEEKKEFDFGMRHDNSPDGFCRKPANAVELVRQQQSCIDSYTHTIFLVSAFLCEGQTTR